MTLESPPRLKHDGELGPLLRAADAAVPAERLAASGAAVKAAIAAGAPTGVPLWKIGLPVLLIAGAALVGRQLVGDDAPPPAAPAIAVAAPSHVIDAAPAPAPADAELEAAAELDAAIAPRPVKRHRVEPAPPAPPDAAPAPPPSDLPEQIELYEQARAASARGDHAAGLDRLAELLRRFPATPLRAEAELTRAELLARADRLDDAAAALEELAASAAHHGRRGELLRTLGDIHRRRGDCAHATDAYTRARAAGLSAGERAKVERGLERCAAP